MRTFQIQINEPKPVMTYDLDVTWKDHKILALSNPYNNGQSSSLRKINLIKLSPINNLS